MQLRRPTFLLALLICSLALGAHCRKADAVVETPEEVRARELLVRYLRFDTSNPPGNETAAARFLAGELRRGGVDARLIGTDPRRQAVYARLASGRPEPGLLLLHHMDVVPAGGTEWTVPPFSGTVSGGYIWGRGALDVKSLGAAELLAFLDLAAARDRLTRDVVFLAVPDEEAGGGAGMKQILERNRELFQGVGLAINEGGGNETVVDHVAFWGIEVDQKIPLWLRLRTKGNGGHAALPPDDGGSALRLIRAVERVIGIERPYRLTPIVQRYFRSLAASKKGAKQEMLRNVASHLGNPKMPAMLSHGYRSLLRDTVAVTRLSGGHSMNALPSTSEADIDIRLLPGSAPDEMLRRVVDAVGDLAQVEVVLKGQQIPPSTEDTELYRILSQVMREAEPQSVVGATVSPGTTDSRFLRASGMTVYGVSPFKVNYYDADSVHGVDERIRTRFYYDGVSLLRTAVRRFCLTGS